MNDYSIQLQEYPESELYDTLEDTQLEQIGIYTKWNLYSALFPSRESFEIANELDFTSDIPGDVVNSIYNRILEFFPQLESENMNPLTIVRSIKLFQINLLNVLNYVLTNYPMYIDPDILEKLEKYCIKNSFFIDITLDYESVIKFYSLLRYLGYQGQLRSKYER